MKIEIPEEPKNYDVYHRGEDWVKLAVLKYLADTGYKLLPGENDAEVVLTAGREAIITVTKKPFWVVGTFKEVKGWK